MNIILIIFTCKTHIYVIENHKNKLNNVGKLIIIMSAIV